MIGSADFANPGIARPPFGNANLPAADIPQDVDARPDSALDVSPNAAQMQQPIRAVTAYVASSSEAHAGADKLIHQKVIPELLEYTLTKASPHKNNWLIANAAGNFGANFWGRAAANYTGICTSQISKVVYVVATKDAHGKTLDGSNSYVIQFPADDPPSSVINSHWSVILVGVPEYRLVPNALKRYSFDTYSWGWLDLCEVLVVLIRPDMGIDTSPSTSPTCSRTIPPMSASARLPVTLALSRSCLPRWNGHADDDRAFHLRVAKLGTTTAPIALDFARMGAPHYGLEHTRGR